MSGTNSRPTITKGLETTERREKAFITSCPSDLIYTLAGLQKLGFFDAPASTKYHGSYEGGLFEHSLAVARELANLTERLGLRWSRSSSPWIVGILHDLCKCDLYKWDGEKFVYNDCILSGHGDKSVIVAQTMITLTEEEIACIRWHMGAFETDTKLWNYYTNAIHRFPNVLYTHTADMIAAHIYNT